VFLIRPLKGGDLRKSPCKGGAEQKSDYIYGKVRQKKCPDYYVSLLEGGGGDQAKGKRKGGERKFDRIVVHPGDYKKGGSLILHDRTSAISLKGKITKKNEKGRGTTPDAIFRKEERGGTHNLSHGGESNRGREGYEKGRGSPLQRRLPIGKKP